jgi:hypothetical protein
MSHNPYDPDPRDPQPAAPKRGMSTGIKVLLWTAAVIVVVPVVGVGLLLGVCFLGSR